MHPSLLLLLAAMPSVQPFVAALARQLATQSSAPPAQCVALAAKKAEKGPKGAAGAAALAGLDALEALEAAEAAVEAPEEAPPPPPAPKLKKKKATGKKSGGGAAAEALEALEAAEAPLAATRALRPVTDVLQRLEYDKGVDASRFVFYFREAQLPVKVGAAWGASNDRVNGTERMLVKAIPQHRIAFVSYGKRLVWHRARRVDRVYGSGVTQNCKLYDVVTEHDAWSQKRNEATAATLEAVRWECGLQFSELRELSRRAAQRDLTPDAWLDAAEDLLDVDLVEDLVVSTPDVALREALADALAERGRPLDAELWVNVF